MIVTSIPANHPYLNRDENNHLQTSLSSSTSKFGGCPPPLTLHTVNTVLNGKFMVIIGGSLDQEMIHLSNHVYILDIESLKWLSTTEIKDVTEIDNHERQCPYPMCAHSANTMNPSPSKVSISSNNSLETNDKKLSIHQKSNIDIIYVFGGRATVSHELQIDNNSLWALKIEIPENKKEQDQYRLKCGWILIEATHAPGGRCKHASCFADQKLVIFGGSSGIPRFDIEFIDLSVIHQRLLMYWTSNQVNQDCSLRWSCNALIEFPEARVGASLFWLEIYPDYVFMFGGFGDWHRNDLWCFNLKTIQWFNVTYSRHPSENNFIHTAHQFSVPSYNLPHRFTSPHTQNLYYAQLLPIITGRWTQICERVPETPFILVYGGEVFGDIPANPNEVWVLNMLTFKWKKFQSPSLSFTEYCEYKTEMKSQYFTNEKDGSHLWGYIGSSGAIHKTQCYIFGGLIPDVGPVNTLSIIEAPVLRATHFSHDLEELFLGV
eukprot:gb/GECH01010455.1/.p1 GENE.gb/GECH01010455.1/~~gb/GECH01010455.1/.p1  ORF type:complete len:490 (+),score=108.45 gb/GECH01010455.1/:1-1470(+)